MDSVARQLITKEAKLRIQRGDPLDDVLAYFRGHGGSKIDAIVVLRDAVGMGLEEAKRVVHFSPAWQDVKQRDERFWDQLDEGPG